MIMTQPCDDVSTGTSRRQDWVTWLLLGFFGIPGYRNGHFTLAC
jgi:hypothetical protein